MKPDAALPGRAAPVPRRSILMLLCLLCAACGGSGEEPARRSTGDAATRLILHGQSSRRELALPGDDPRAPLLLAELDSLFAAARPHGRQISRRLFMSAKEHGALEFRFASARRVAVADGDSLDVWRVLLPFGVEADPVPGATALFLGNPGWDTGPWLSKRQRIRILSILEGER